LRNGSELLGQGEWSAKYGGGVADMKNTFVGGFSSYHPGTGNFLFADGSVHAASLNIDPTMLENLANRSDGAMMGDFR